MFYGCKLLSDIKSIEKWDISNGNNFSYMFYGCSSLSDISFIKNWNFSNIQLNEYPSSSDFKLYNFSYMFSGCLLLSDIKSLEKWNELHFI